MTTIERVKVTHTFSAETREQVRQLVESGAVKDASTFIEEAVRAALRERKFQQLQLELSVFDDPEYVSQVAALGDDGLEDITAEFRRE